MTVQCKDITQYLATLFIPAVQRRLPFIRRPVSYRVAGRYINLGYSDRNLATHGGRLFG
jgi:hypothetical protein